MFLVLKHINPTGFCFSLNAMIMNQDLNLRQSMILDGLKPLALMYPWISVRAYGYSFTDLVRQSGIEFPSTARCILGVSRLYVPLLFRATWFLYLDADIEAVADFFPEILTFTSNASKVFFVVPDQTILSVPADRYRIKKMNLGIDPNTYFNSGFLFMRGGCVLNQQLRNAIVCLRENLTLKYPDQDALNFGIDRRLMVLLPWKFFTGRDAFAALGNQAYIRHYNGHRKTEANDIGLKLSILFRKVKQNSSSHDPGVSRRPNITLWSSSQWTDNRDVSQQCSC
jgi:hypothetical protein